MAYVVEGHLLPGIYAYCACVRQTFALAAAQPNQFPCIDVTALFKGWERAAGVHIFSDSELLDDEGPGDYDCNTIMGDYGGRERTALVYALFFMVNTISWAQAQEDVHGTEEFETDDSGTDSWYCFAWGGFEFHIEWMNAEPPEGADPDHMFVQVRAKPVV